MVLSTWELSTAVLMGVHTLVDGADGHVSVRTSHGSMMSEGIPIQRRNNGKLVSEKQSHLASLFD
jgi:hypothetical protein